MHMGMGPPMPQRLRPRRNTDIDRIEHPNDGLLYEKRPIGKFPVAIEGKHIIAHGKPRTASTLLFNMVGVSNFLYLMRHEPNLVSYIEPKYIKDGQPYEEYLREGPAETTKIYKTHIDLEKFLRYDAAIFTTATTSKEAASVKSILEEQGHDVAYVQDMQRLKREGIPSIAQDFAFGYDLPKEDEEKMVEYFSKWEILRQCCGEQMSKYWKNDLTPDVYKKVTLKDHPHPFCADHDIDEIEKGFMETKLYSKLDAYPNMRPFNKPSLRDGELNGTYCSSYNQRIKTEALNFYGQPLPMENIRTGNWTEEEHSIFLEGLKIHGSRKPSKIAKMLETRTVMQVYTHIKDYIEQQVQSGNDDDDELVKVMERPALEGGDLAIGEIALAYDETGKLILVDKTSMSEIQVQVQKPSDDT